MLDKILFCAILLTMRTTYTKAQVLRMLREKLDAAGSLRALSRQSGIDVGYLSRVLNKGKGAEISPAILKFLKLKKVVSYRRDL